MSRQEPIIRPTENRALDRMSSPPLPELEATARQFDRHRKRGWVAKLLDSGKSRSEIIQITGLSPGNVDEQLRKIERKRKLVAKRLQQSL